MLSCFQLPILLCFEANIVVMHFFIALQFLKCKKCFFSNESSSFIEVHIVVCNKKILFILEKSEENSM